MKNLLKLEELFLLLLAIYLFSQLDYTWWWFAVLFLAPDLGMIGYVAGPSVGAVTYNLLHHKGVAIGFYLVGVMSGIPILQFVGLIMLAHASFDRILGYGLKYADAFTHTHLGMIGSAAKQ